MRDAHLQFIRLSVSSKDVKKTVIVILETIHQFLSICSKKISYSRASATNCTYAILQATSIYISLINR